jgi:hypothetical protein
MLLQVPPRDGVIRTASVRATAPGTLPATLYNLSFDFTPADTADTTNGPGGVDCVGGISQHQDIVEFDSRSVLYIDKLTSEYPDAGMHLLVAVLPAYKCPPLLPLLKQVHLHLSDR